MSVWATPIPTATAPTPATASAASALPRISAGPACCKKKLGQDYLVIEEGLSGRTTCFDDPIHEGLSALNYIYPCLKSHENVDLLIIMLGTNDTKERLGTNPFVIGKGMERLVRKAMSVDCWQPGKQPKVLIIAPPPIGDGVLTNGPVVADMGKNAPAISRGIAEYYKATAELLGVHFLDAAFCQFNKVDYMHLTRQGHAQLAEKLAQLVPEILAE